MYNFLDQRLTPKVSTKTACMDDYEVKNLISSNPMIKARGFLAYTSIKPPVDIDFELICPISLQYITICTTVGTQKSVGIEIFTKNSSQFTSIAKAFYTECGITFYNSRFFSKTNPPKDANNGFYMQAIKSYSFRDFIHTKLIRIRILATERSVPCIGRIEIWGRVSKNCSKITLDTIKKLMSVSERQVETLLQISDTNYVDKESQDFEIPDDYKDALTFEIMALPMTLPSGHTIDQSTLEKCTSNDAIHGRRCLDPFTGVEFTQSCKPKLNVSLKSRIDMFLMENAHRKEILNTRRTVGRSFKQNGRGLGEKLKRSANNDDHPNTKKIHLDHSEIPSYSKNIDNIETFESTNESNKNATKDSLDEAIAKVINNSGFICFTKDETNEVKIDCVKCKCVDNLYVLPCTHLFCRKCLLDICTVLICFKCNANFKKNDAIKFHS